MGNILEFYLTKIRLIKNQLFFRGYGFWLSQCSKFSFLVVTRSCSATCLSFLWTVTTKTNNEDTAYIYEEIFGKTNEVKNFLCLKVLGQMEVRDLMGYW